MLTSNVQPGRAAGAIEDVQGHALYVRAQPEEAADQWSLIAHSDGHRIGHLLVHYIVERERLTDRWHGALRDWPGPLAFAWGRRDPVATPRVVEGLRQLRPTAPVITFPDVGHYPQIERPDRIAAALDEAIAWATTC